MPIQVVVDQIAMVFQSPRSETRAINNISFKVEEGQFVSIVGPSGCGKSTLLDIICGLQTPTRGEVQVNGNMGYML